MRITVLDPGEALTAELLHDVLALVCVDVPPAAIELWTEHERLLAYDWAMREHLRASDNLIRARPRPAFLSNYQLPLDFAKEAFE